MFGRRDHSVRSLLRLELFPLLFYGGIGNGFPTQGQVIPELFKPGWYEPGEYQVACGIYVDPPDATQLGPVGPAKRSPQVNETGMQAQVITTVRERGRDGRLLEPNLVEASKEGGPCVAVLLRPGTYQVTMETSISQWIWGISQEASSVSVQRLRRQDLSEKFDRKQFIVRVRGDCPEEGNARTKAADSKENDPVADRLREALSRVLSELGQEVDSNSVSVEPVAPGGLWRFAVRISGQGCILPSLDSFADCSSTAPGSATHLLVGSLQIAGGASRFNARVVDVETGEVLTATRGDTQGTETEALLQAASDAIRGLSFSIDCGQ